MTNPTSAQLVQLAWDVLPAGDRRLLEQMGASRWEIVAEPLGVAVDARLRSAGHDGHTPARIQADNAALGMWIRELRLVLINEKHEALIDTDQATREALLTWVAWHEWGHALSIEGPSAHDPAEGDRLLALAPDGIRERVRRAHYPRREYIHELIAETYALLMREKVEGRSGQPSWLPNEIYNLMARVASSSHNEGSR
ncbi:MAG TPA: hypothetical protein VG147_05890 [Solirubrobacteraceae bacterium]|nr:hypothetical protein [Solirubrobacteraceae bacterium]